MGIKISCSWSSDYSILTNDDSVYQNYQYIVFDISISYRIVSSRKVSNFSIYRDILYISRHFRYIAIFYATGLYFYYCITKITKINGENDKITEAKL